MHPPELDIRLLGRVQLLADGTPLAVRGRKPQTLLAALTVHRRQAISIERLAEAIWGETPPARPAAGLHGYLSVLRTRLRAAGADDTGILRTLGGGSYLLHVDDAQCDIGRFERARAAGSAAAAAGDTDAAAAAFDAALAEWRGEAVAGLRGVRFADRLAADLAERRMQVLLGRGDAYIAGGRAEAVVAELRGLADERPLHDGVWQRLIRALYAAGRQVDALNTYRQFALCLADTHGLDPDPATTALRDAILRREPTGPPPPDQKVAW